MDYSPDRRTALVLCGTGAHGAYHAGVLRACREAGLRIDLIAGHGVGAGAAVLAAIDGGSAVWDEQGIWQKASDAHLYRWSLSLRVAGWLMMALAAVIGVPVLLLVVSLIVYAVGFLLGMLGLSVGADVVGWYTAWLQFLFAGPNLPTVIPRAALIVGVAVIVALAVGAVFGGRHGAARRPWRRRWGFVGAPLDGQQARRVFGDAVWQLIRGAAEERRPAPEVAGRRYGEVLEESLGQPGVCELLFTATDLDARQDLVAALLREPYRSRFFSAMPGRERQAEAIDLAGDGGAHLLSVLGGALTPWIGVEPSFVRFAPDSFWRGETHRLCDRSAGVHRLLVELKRAGVEQVVLVSAVASHAEPHRLWPADTSIRGRIGDALVASEAAALQDALAVAGSTFVAVHTVRPVHNPLGPFDFGGAYDRASDRWCPMVELLERGYEDAHRQFIDPVIGASGERFASTVEEWQLDDPPDEADS